jgi:carbamoyl-phosphate synthase small subunit
MLGVISKDAEPPSFFSNPNNEHLVAQACNKNRKRIGEGLKRVIVVDCGIKDNILRCLAQWPVTLECVPYDYDYSEEEYEGLLISNGPGDPARCVETICILQKAMKRHKPMFGICLGTQLMALAAGAKTYKLIFGHRGHNQPCIDTLTQKCYITSQNHGYAVDADSLPKDWRVSFKNMNDGSVEGIAHKSLPYFAVQFHPEASPGPTDTHSLFEQFYQML